MKKIGKKGFTLIELLAVITIMGILMLVAIPAVSRTIENTRRDSFANVAKEYISTIRNAVIADELKCGTESVSSTVSGNYYFKIDSTEQDTKDLMESGGKSSWGNADVKGYVSWEKTITGDGGQKINYSIVLVDKANHGIKTETKEEEIVRTKVVVNTAASDPKTGYVAGSGITAVATSKTGATECKLNK